jgi:3-oxoacyl-[acyl-carrier protein] reductase
MDLGIRGRIALIGGSSSGLGRAVAEELAENGVDVVLCSRSATNIAEAADQIRQKFGVRAIGIPANLSDRSQAQDVASRAVREFGRVDILVNNTGGPPAGPFESHDAETWHQTYHLLLESVLTLTRSVLPGMKDRGWGRIINITSIAVKQPVEGLVLSNSLRAAVTGFARTLANEIGHTGITVNNVMPGYTKTDRLVHLAKSNAERKGSSVEDAYAQWEREIPMKRLGEPREFAALVAFLASERASYITGTSIPVDGGWIRSLI